MATNIRNGSSIHDNFSHPHMDTTSQTDASPLFEWPEPCVVWPEPIKPTTFCTSLTNLARPSTQHHASIYPHISANAFAHGPAHHLYTSAAADLCLYIVDHEVRVKNFGLRLFSG